MKHNINENQIKKLKSENNYIFLDTNEIFLEKPQHMTSLKENILVLKNNNQIIFRGQLDIFLSELLLFMQEVLNNKILIQDLKEIKNHLKKIQYSEVTEKILDEEIFLGLNSNEIKNHSHFPKKYYNQEHLFNLDYTENYITLKLNYFRGKIRELEIYSFNAFFINDNLTRTDILNSLNTISSVFYIMEIKSVSNFYS